MNRLVLLPLALVFTACGLTEVENTLDITGTVVAAADGGGYSAGQPIDGAEVTLRYSAPLETTSIIRDTDITASDGTFSVSTGPPTGQNEPNCDTLSVSAVKVGFLSVTVRLSGMCQGTGELNGVIMEMTPN